MRESFLDVAFSLKLNLCKKLKFGNAKIVIITFLVRRSLNRSGLAEVEFIAGIFKTWRRRRQVFGQNGRAGSLWWTKNLGWKAFWTNSSILPGFLSQLWHVPRNIQKLLQLLLARQSGSRFLRANRDAAVRALDVHVTLDSPPQLWYLPRDVHSFSDVFVVVHKIVVIVFSASDVVHYVRWGHFGRSVLISVL